jgi:hypothetical protein
MRDSSEATSSRGFPASKIPPQFRGPPHEIVVPPDEIFQLERHICLRVVQPVY